MRLSGSCLWSSVVVRVQKDPIEKSENARDHFRSSGMTEVLRGMISLFPQLVTLQHNGVSVIETEDFIVYCGED